MPRAKLSQKFYSQPIAPEALSHVLRDVLPHIELAHRDGNLAVRLKRMRNMILNGALKMSYGKKICDKAGNEYGREYSKLPLSFPNLNRKIRNALVNHHIEMSGKRCVDIDVATCHPKVFVQLLEKRGVRSDRDLIVKYVNELKRIPEEVHSVCSCDRDTAKSLLLALINFGTVKGWAWINKVALPPGAETTDIHRFLENYYKSKNEDNMLSIGICLVKGKGIMRNLGCSSYLKAAIPYIPPYIPLNNDFLVTKYKSTYRKIKFHDGVYNMATDTFRPSFVDEYFMVEVPVRNPTREHELT
eukprot:jgi/Tetstr1/428089/TSEL_018144.t1